MLEKLENFFTNENNVNAAIVVGFILAAAAIAVWF